VKFTRRHARALAAGAATTAAYLAAGRAAGSTPVRAAGRAAGSTPVRAAGLLLLATTALAGVQASAIAKTTKKRLDQHIADTQPAVHFINHGGTVSGAITCSGVSTGGGSVNTSGGSISSGSISCGGISMGGALTMNNNTGGTFSHITASQIGPGGDRALLGAGATLAQVQARCDFLLQQLEGANVCY
jgi:hypothetical protein